MDLDGEALDTLRQRERGAVEKGTLKIRSMDLEDAFVALGAGAPGTYALRGDGA